MNEYELLYIVSPRVPADDVAKAIERVSALVTAQGGRIHITSRPGEGTSVSMIWPLDPAEIGLRTTPHRSTTEQREASERTKAH